MKNRFYLDLLAIVTVILLLSGCSAEKKFSFTAGDLRLTLNAAGELVEMTDLTSGTNYLAPGQPAPLLSIKMGDSVYSPSALKYLQDDDLLLLKYDAVNVEATVRIQLRQTHLTFELIDISHDDVDLVIWGPYPTSISKSIGETVGVARGETYALGVQALNPKTLGGYPWNDNDCMPQIDIFENGDYSDLSEKGKRYVLYRVEAAKPDTFGSTLQAYCRNRYPDRIVSNWGFDDFLVPAYDDGGVTGSKIALFGCAVDNTLDVIGQIEVEEGLPHPMIDGKWGKKSATANASYLILDFREEDIDKALDYTKKAGLQYLYHSGPFRTWGHFELNDQFPHGREGLARCVDKAAKLGVHLGVHVLSNFITTNDPYVTPMPDKRLAIVNYSYLTREINTSENDIPVASPSPFNELQNNNLRTVRIGNELIQYEKVSDKEPWLLLNCTRGAFGTEASSHGKGDTVALLADHGYMVFLSDADLTQEIAINIAELFNATGLRQISFDGLEGNRSTGMGNYGEILMTTTWYDYLSDEIKSHYIADASRTSHYFWHIYSRMNWGEPWYAGFRESQTEYRFKNQAYFERNLMPGMLGWFQFRENTSPEDIEWMLAKAAGYNAGFGFVSSYDTFEKNGATDEILALISTWENARLNGEFSDSIRALLRDQSKEFHLEKNADGSLSLTIYDADGGEQGEVKIPNIK